MSLNVNQGIRYFKLRFLSLILFFNDYPSLLTCFTILVFILLSTKFLEIRILDGTYPNHKDILYTSLCIIPLILFFFVSYRSRRPVLNISTLIKTFLIGSSLISISYYYKTEKITKEMLNVQSFIGKEVSIEGVLVSQDNYNQYTLRPTDPSIGNIVLRLREYSDLHVGQRCTFSGQLVEPSSFDDFDYKRFLFRKQIYSILEVGEYSVCENGSTLLTFRYRLERIIERSVPEPEASLLVGIMFGSKRVYLKEFNESLRSAGVSHIISASGYNVALLTIAIDRFTSFLKGRVSLFTKISCIWVFAIFAGLSSSLVRASTMSTIYFLSFLLGRYTSKSVVVIFCATLLLLLNPFLIHDIGFLLSLLSTVGLIFFPKCFESYKILPFIKESVLPTMTCVLFTLPIVIMFFGKVSIVSVLTNVLVVPIIQSTIFWGLGITIINLLIPIKILYIVPYLQIKVFKYIVDLTSLVPMLEVNISPLLISLSIYISIALFCLLKYPISNENYYLRKSFRILNGYI
jgi:ComEC/Rec2-related protein